MSNVTPLHRERKSGIPLCKNCESFHESMGIGSPPYCSSPKRKGDFDPVYGWQEKSVRAHDARRDNDDCGLAGNFYEEKEYLGSEPTPLENPFDKKPWFFSWKRLITYIKR